MADPRVFTVDNGTSATCRNGDQLASSNRRSFFEAAGKIGDLNVLNDVGAGDVGRGLRTLASISNSVRTGCGAQPSILGDTLGKVLDSVDDGAEWVLSKVGLSGTIAKAVEAFHPGVANAAYGSAKNVYDRVKQGNFSYTDIPSFMQDFQDLERLGRSIFTPSEGDAQTALSDVCQASPYAMDLVNRAPKYKFLFLVQFIYKNATPGGAAENAPTSLAFLVKKVERPDVEYVTEEVNYYNFMTNVITGTKNKDMSMTFHDDTNNQAMWFYNNYRHKSVPNSNLQSPVNMVYNGMNPNVGQSSASFGPFLIQDSTNTTQRKYDKALLQEIRLFHLYDYGNYMNVYKFFNPRITALDLDGLDMSEGSSGCELTLKFAYDAVNISKAAVSKAGIGNEGMYDIEQISHAGDGRLAQFPMRYVDDTAAVTSAVPELPISRSSSDACNSLNTTATPQGQPKAIDALNGNDPTDPTTARLGEFTLGPMRDYNA